MAEKRRGLGRGLGALIPTAPTGESRPVDVFFPGPSTATTVLEREPDAGDAAVPVVPGDAAEPVPSVVDEVPLTAEGVRELAGDAPSVPVVDVAAQERPIGGRSAMAEAAVAGGALADAEVMAVDVAHVDVTELRATETTVIDAASIDGAPTDGAPTDGAPSQGMLTDDGVGLLPVPGAHFAELPVASVRPNPRQPRTVFDEDALAELVGSIREIGVLQPVVVRPAGTAEDGTAAYELIMGERRWRASQVAGMATVPAIVRETDDADLLRDALLENLHRSDLNPLEEAAAYQQLLDDFGCTHDELARRIHRSRPQISNTLRLLRLPPLVQRRVAAGVLSAGHARALLGLPDQAAMERLAQRIVAEGLSVRATEEVVALGGDASRGAAPRRTRMGERNEALEDLAVRLSDRLDTRVKIALGRTKGSLTVEFASVEDLDRILATLSPEDAGLMG